MLHVLHKIVKSSSMIQLLYFTYICGKLISYCHTVFKPSNIFYFRFYSISFLSPLAIFFVWFSLCVLLLVPVCGVRCACLYFHYTSKHSTLYVVLMTRANYQLHSPSKITYNVKLLNLHVTRTNKTIPFHKFFLIFYFNVVCIHNTKRHYFLCSYFSSSAPSSAPDSPPPPLSSLLLCRCPPLSFSVGASDCLLSFF